MTFAKKGYILDKMVKDKLPYYQIKCQENKNVIDENNTEKDSENASRRLGECIESLEGEYIHIRISDKMFRGDEAQTGALKAGVYHFRVRLNSETKNVPIGSVNDSELIRRLDRLEKENELLKEQRRNDEIRVLTDRIKELEREGKEEASNPILDNFLAHIGNHIMSGGARPIHDNFSHELDQVEDMTEEQQKVIDRLNNAIAIISERDKNYVNNIERLAILAKKNPIMYKQAVNMLHNFTK